MVDKVGHIVVLLLISGSVNLFGQTERSLNNEGNKLFKDGQYSDAEVNYRKVLEQNSESFHGSYNLGNALYKQQKYDEAGEKYTASMNKPELDSRSRANSYYNIANTMFGAEKYKESVEAYKNALKLNPGDMDSKHNLALAQKMLRQQQQQQQQNKDNQDQNNEENKENQEQQQQQDQNKEENQENKEQENQQQDQNDQQKQQDQAQQKPQEPKISKEDAERMLEALNNEERNIQDKLKRHVAAQRVKIEKDW
ncbi:tetratricopeptide repeat protein [bacterium AH-315-C07]|nr:tetratricopeptide repeat protein [bacterium AH-315-C07]